MESTSPITKKDGRLISMMWRDYFADTIPSIRSSRWSAALCLHSVCAMALFIVLLLKLFYDKPRGRVKVYYMALMAPPKKTFTNVHDHPLGRMLLQKLCAVSKLEDQISHDEVKFRNSGVETPRCNHRIKCPVTLPWRDLSLRELLSLAAII